MGHRRGFHGQWAICCAPLSLDNDWVLIYCMYGFCP